MQIDIFEQNPVLENDRAILRAIRKDDYAHLLPFSQNEPDIWKYGLLTAAGEANLRSYIDGAVKNMEEKKEFVFIVYDKPSGRYAGSTRFYDILPSFGSAQLGYTWYGREFQRTGLNRHCKLLLLTYAFETWELERLEFRAHAGNQASIRAMEAIGCVMEGTLRSHMPTVDGSRRDSVVLSILKSEWFGGVRDRLREKTR
ncbi:MAG: GNAT family N-acetyltransferase [Chitinophagaceae bacterium]